MALASARADAPRTERVELTGNRRTRATTVLDLLPRPPPADYSDDELRETERRLKNLEIFDEVAMARDGHVLRILVREKWTLVPKFELATGSTYKDTYVLLGATEHNFLGYAGSLGLSVFHEQRGYGFHAMYEEHLYRRHRWALGAETKYGSSEFLFPNHVSWSTRDALVYLWTTTPTLGSDHARIELGAYYERQTVHAMKGDARRPRNGHTLGASVMLTWDQYTWHDLVPSGFLINVSGTAAAFVGRNLLQNRARGDLELRASVPLARYTALMARLKAGVMARGNPNHSLLIGSVEGVRGLKDTWYFNWLQAFVNLELRQAIPLAARWALQAVVFADAAAFERLDANGDRARGYVAFSGGGGVRVVPTWIAALVPRFDVARLVLPQRAMLYQFGVSQYF